MKTELEKRIKSEFDNMEVDVSGLIQGIKNPPESLAKRPRLRYSAGKLAAAIIIAIALMASGVAAAIYIGSFDRLVEIVGSEQAEFLQPMGDLIDVINIDNFRVEVVAVGVDANVVDLYLTIEDLVGGRLDEGFIVTTNIQSMGNLLDLNNSESPNRAFARQEEYIHRTAEGIITLHNRHIFPQPVTGQTLAFGDFSIIHSFRSKVVDIDIDLSELETHTPIAWIWDTPILPLHMHDIRLTPDGFDNAFNVSISSIGIIDGMLHIQEKFVGSTYVNVTQVVDPYGEVVLPIRSTANNTASISFGIDREGNPYNDRGYNFATFPYRQGVFEVDISRLSEYRLFAEFSTHEWTRRVHNYTFFEVKLPDEITEFLVADEGDMWLSSMQVIIKEVRVSPFTVIIDGFSPGRDPDSGFALASTRRYDDGRFVQEVARVIINMADGSVIDTVRSDFVTVTGIENLGDPYYFIETFHIQAPRIELDEVVSIQIAELVIPLR